MLNDETRKSMARVVVSSEHLQRGITEIFSTVENQEEVIEKLTKKIEAKKVKVPSRDEDFKNRALNPYSLMTRYSKGMGVCGICAESISLSHGGFYNHGKKHIEDGD